MSEQILRKDVTMISKSRWLLVAAALIAAPVGAAVAQQGTTSGTQPNNNSPSAAPNSPHMNNSSAATDPHVPGATGQTVVPGSSSSMAGSHRVDPNPNSAATDAGGSSSK
jgi:hypothetical protein